MEISYITTLIFAATSILFFINWQKAQKSIREFENENIENKTRLEEKELKLSDLQNEYSELEDELKSELKTERDSRIDAETKIKLACQEVENVREEMNNWEKTKQQHLESAKAAMLDAGGKMSNKLLEDHKREVEQAKKDSEDNVKKTTEELHQKFHTVFESMGNLNEQIKSTKETSDLVKNALLSPSGAGSLAEITLENIFKASGLIENQDYIMQYHVNSEGKSLRPDAIVFLPDDNYIVIDCKASKFFMELAQIDESSDEFVAMNSKLKSTMASHLKDLVGRDYKKAVEDSLKDKGHENKVHHVDVLMFLPSETALDKIRIADKQFEEKAWKEHIFPVGHTGLINTLLRAKLFISNIRQEENSKVIIDEVKNMLVSVAKLHDLSSSMGKSIKSSFDKYDKFAGSFNSNFLSKVKKLDKLGVSLPKNKDIKQLERFQIISSGGMIDGESEEISEQLQIRELEGVE